MYPESSILKVRITYATSGSRVWPVILHTTKGKLVLDVKSSSLWVFKVFKEHKVLFSRGNKCHLMAKSFLREKTEPTIFGIWQVAYSEASITLSEKRTPFFKLLRTSLFCCFQKRLTPNLEEKANRLKIFIRTNYVLAIKFG